AIVRLHDEGVNQRVRAVAVADADLMITDVGRCGPAPRSAAHGLELAAARLPEEGPRLAAGRELEHVPWNHEGRQGAERGLDAAEMDREGDAPVVKIALR